MAQDYIQVKNCKQKSALILELLVVGVICVIATLTWLKNLGLSQDSTSYICL